MIKLNEFRIGNMVLFEGKPTKININSFKRLLDFDSESDYEGIPLTPEILERCGFEKINDFYSIRIDEYIWLHFYEDGIYGLWSDSIENESNFTVKSQDNRIKYLHQLQNLIFALTGEELVIKELQTV